MTKTLISICTILAFTGTAFSHSGHTEIVQGHRHSLLDLAITNATPIGLGLAAIAVMLFVRGRQL